MSIPEIQFHQLFIDGQWVAGANGQTLEARSPHDDSRIAMLHCGGASDVNAAVTAASKAFHNQSTSIHDGGWSHVSGTQRASVLRSIAAELRTRADRLARLEVADCGKPLAEANWDIGDAATCFEYYAGLAEQLDAKQNTPIDSGMEEFKITLRYEPVGVLALIVPWNYPLLMATWKVAPALAAGCSLVLKPSENTSVTSLELADIMQKAGVPRGVFNVVTGYGSEVGEALTTHPDVQAIAFTGSTRTGSHIMGNAAKDIKNVSLELGGKSPIVVFDDVDIDKTVEWLLFGFCFTNGQICSATSRAIIHESVAPAILKRLQEEADKVSVGDPFAEDTKLGPLVNKIQYDKVMEYIESAKTEGATVLAGGVRPANVPASGFYLRPTVLTNVEPHMRVWREEIFGPVLSVKTFRTEDEAIALANDSEYGLAGAVISKDNARCQRVASNIQAGIVWINCAQPTFCQAPWGGSKKSGIGRDLGEYGFNRFLEVKQITEYVVDKPWGWYIKPKL